MGKETGETLTTLGGNWPIRGRLIIKMAPQSTNQNRALDTATCDCGAIWIQFCVFFPIIKQLDKQNE